MPSIAIAIISQQSQWFANNFYNSKASLSWLVERAYNVAKETICLYICMYCMYVSM